MVGGSRNTGAVSIALAAYGLATLGAEFATVFTNAMMPDLMSPKQLGQLSGIGWAMDYLGGFVSLVVVLGFLAADTQTGRTILGFAPILGLDPATHAGDRSSGPMTTIWYLVFVLPPFVFVPDTSRKMQVTRAVGLGLSSLRKSLAHARKEKTIWLFLAASMAYRGALTALFAFGGTFAAGQLGWQALQIELFGILLTVTGTAGALVGGFLDDRFGPRPVLIGAIAILSMCCAAIVSIDRDTILFVIDVAPPAPGALFGSVPELLYLVLGGFIGAAAVPLQTASCTLLINLSPPCRITEIFDLYALAGKATSFVEPLTVAALTAFSGSQRVGISAIIVLFALGALLLAKVPAMRATGE
ncbi:MFS transporter [Breoghania sp.]|uniref:MFS transporter n=1 Tax=Breoghania sp. TaxID=2065378 RepID=UPI003204A62C